MDANRCVCCGEIVPEGTMVCPNCKKELWNQTQIRMSKPDGIQNIKIPEKCKYCDHFFNYICQAKQCTKER